MFVRALSLQNLKLVGPPEENVDSLHYLMLPDPIEGASDPDIERAVGVMQDVINSGRKIREQQKKSMKQPLKELTVVSADPQHLKDVQSLSAYIMSELNIGTVKCEDDDGTWSVNKLVPNFRALGKKLGKDMPKVKNAVMALSTKDIDAFVASGSMTVEGYTMSAEEIEVVKSFKGESDTIKGAMADKDGAAAGCLVLLNTELDDELLSRGLAREFVNRVQKMRKTGGLAAADKIEVFYEQIVEKGKKIAKGGKGAKGAKGAAASIGPAEVLLSRGGEIGASLGTPAPVKVSLMPSHCVPVAEEVVEVDEVQFRLVLTRLTVGFKQEALLSACAGDAELAADCVSLVSTLDYQKLVKEGTKILPVVLDDKAVNLAFGKELFWSACEGVRA